jgi:ArsR family transcriptional regulator
MIGIGSHAPSNLDNTVRIMRVLAESTRLKILELLRNGEMNVSMLCEHLDLAQPTVSHHLGLLREEGLLTSRRAGKNIYYCLNQQIVRDGPTGGITIATGQMMLSLNGHVPSDAVTSSFEN